MAKKPTITDVLKAIEKLPTHEDLQALASHIDERFATKDDLRSFATKDDLAGLESRLMTEIDRFVVLHQRMDVELVATRARFERIEEKLERNNIR